jgi:carnitine-CoA ligase
MVDLIGARTLRDLLTEQAALRPDHVFLVHEDLEGTSTELTYRSFLDLVDRTAVVLAARGVGPGAKVTVHLANSPEIVAVWFALASLGAVMVPSNTANTAAELDHVVRFSDSGTVVTSPDYADRFAAFAGDPEIDLLLCREDGTRPPAGFTAVGELVARADPSALELPEVVADDVVELLFTSGTTAKAKAVMLTHANCLHAGERCAKGLLLDQRVRYLTSLPVFHVNAQATSVLSALTVGGTVILLEQFSASRYLDQVRQHEATAMSIVATQVRTLLAQSASPSDADHGLERVFYAINVTDEEKDAFEQRFGVSLINGYGLSEAMTLITLAPVFGEKRWPSVGRPAHDREVRLLDPDGHEVPVGEVGEIVVRGTPGRTIMRGYYKDDRATSETIRDGWLHTGDLGRFDRFGHLYFFDRLKDVIKRAGENVSAVEVESVLLEHPDIEEAAVIGVPDPVRDEAVKAFVVLREGAELDAAAVVEYCSGHLARFKVPTIVEFSLALPRTSVGKIEKRRLRGGSGSNGGAS